MTSNLIQSIPLHPLWDSIRSCTLCPLHTFCQGPVPGSGPIDASIMFIGEAPGRNEDAEGIPFIGQAGQILEAMLAKLGLTRHEVYITNVVKCRPEGNRDPSTEEIALCASSHLMRELEMVKPDIVVTLGRFATRYILGLDEFATMDTLHAQAQFDVKMGAITRVHDGQVMYEGINIPIVFPIYHPAAGLHNTSLIREIASDFVDLEDIMEGMRFNGLDGAITVAKLKIREDEYPSPHYWSSNSIELIKQILNNEEEIALDTEYIPADESESGTTELLSVQISWAEGDGLWLSAATWREYVEDSKGRPFPQQILVYVHNLPADAEALGWDTTPSLMPTRYRDTMQMAYLLGLPLGLKALARELCGMDMQDFSDIVRPLQHRFALDWAEKAHRGSDQKEMEDRRPKRGQFRGKGSRAVWEQARDAYKFFMESSPVTPFSDSAPYEITEWDNKNMRLTTRMKQPQNATTRLRKLMNDYNSGAISNVWDRIRGWKGADIQPLLDRCGPCPRANLSHVDEKVAKDYASRDPDATLRVAHKLLPMLQAASVQRPTDHTDATLVDVLDDMDGAMLPSIMAMMRNGIAIDPSHFRILSAELLALMEEQASIAALEAGKLLATKSVQFSFPEPPQDEETVDYYGFNPASAVQKVKLLFELLRYPPTQLNEDSGLPKTDIRSLKVLATAYDELWPLVDAIVEYQHLHKLKTTYSDKLPGFAKFTGETVEVHPDFIEVATEGSTPLEKEDVTIQVSTGHHRVHTSIRTTSTETGRISTFNPNLMAVPTRHAQGKRIREGFIPSPPHPELGPMSFLFIDYSQIEYRVMAHLSGCARLLSIYANSKDVHSITTTRITGLTPSQSGFSEARRSMKIMGFGTMYGMTTQGLLESMIQEDIKGWDLEQCEEFHNEYFELYPEIKSYQYAVAAEGRRYGYVKDMWGRIRHTPEFLVPIQRIQNQGERQAINMPIQGGAQGIIKKAQVDIWNAHKSKFNPQDPIVKWLLQIHDELGWEVPTSMISMLSRQFAKIMESVITLSVPIVANIKTSANSWGELEE